MKFALVNGQREEARPNLSGECPGCGRLMVARCGEVRVRHWAHKQSSVCDPWWENETEWHRAWKDQFPADWQENVQHAETGECHIADVKTPRGWVIEFQHSYLKPEERRGVNGSAYLAPYSRAKFIESHCNGGAEIAAREFDEFVSEIPKLVANYESWTATQCIQGIQRYPIVRNRSRRRF